MECNNNRYDVMRITYVDRTVDLDKDKLADQEMVYDKETQIMYIKTDNRLVAVSDNKKTTYDTVIELQASIKSFDVGDFVEVLGYYEKGDGADHKRMVVEEVDKDGSGVLLDNGKWANIVIDGTVDIRWFGAKADAVLGEIEVSGTDCSSFVNKAIEYAGRYITVTGAGNFRLSASVELNANCDFSDANFYCDPDVAVGFFIFTALSQRKIYSFGKVMTTKKYAFNDGWAVDSSAFILDNINTRMTYIKLDAKEVSRFRKGFNFETANGNTIASYNIFNITNMEDCKYAIYIDSVNDYGPSFVNQNVWNIVRIRNNSVAREGSTKIYTRNCNENIFNDVCLEGGKAIHSFDASNKFVNCRYEAVQDGGIVIDRTSKSNYQNTLLQDGYGLSTDIVDVGLNSSMPNIKSNFSSFTNGTNDMATYVDNDPVIRILGEGTNHYGRYNSYIELARKGVEVFDGLYGDGTVPTCGLYGYLDSSPGLVFRQFGDGLDRGVRRHAEGEVRIYGINLNTGFMKNGATQHVAVNVGEQYFRTDLNIPTWWNGTNWVDATGTTVI